jgi:hypothetical protein
MPTTVTSTTVTFNDGTVQNTGAYTYLDGTGTMQQVTYSIGQFLLIENQTLGSFTVACPLNGWDSSVYSAPVFVNNQSFSSPTGGVMSNTGSGNGFVYQRAALNASFTLTGTWRNRGGNLVCFLVQRVA